MTFEKFFREVELEMIRSEEFQILEQPHCVVSERTQIVYRVVALAYSPSRNSYYAIGVNQVLGIYHIVTLGRLAVYYTEKDKQDFKANWVESKIFFQKWVQQWIAQNPGKLIQAGITIGLASDQTAASDETTAPEEHWHNVYVTQTVQEVVNSLRRKGIKVEYCPNPDNPEDPNGYIEEYGGVISSCIRWRESEKKDGPPVLDMTPKEAMACLQLLSSAKNFKQVRKATESTFNIIKDCTRCKV